MCFQCFSYRRGLGETCAFFCFIYRKVVFLGVKFQITKINNMEASVKSGFKTSKESSNFWNNLYTLGAAIFAVWAIPFPLEEIMGLHAAVVSKTIVSILIAALMVFQAVRNIVKNYKFGSFKDVLKNWNVWNNVISTIAAGLAALAIGFPEAEAANLLEAIKGGQIQLIAVAAFQFLNMAYHLWIKKPDELATK